MSPNTIFITGATGVQGSAAIRALSSHATLSYPITVHALVRDPDSDKAATVSALANNNLTVKLFKGTFDDVPSLRAAAKDCTAAFINVSPSLDPSDLNAEPRHFSNILSALVSTPSIKTVVYPTVNGVADPSVPGNFKSVTEATFMYTYLASKSGNEEALRTTSAEQGWNHTILQPAYFLTNFHVPAARFMFAQLPERKIVTAFPEDMKHSYLDPSDIVRFAAAVFVADDKEMSEKWNGKKIPLASVNVPQASVVAVINEVLGLNGSDGEIRIEYMSEEQAREAAKSNPLVASQFYIIDNPKPVDVDKVRSYGIELGGVEDFFVANRKALEEAVGL